MVEDIKECNKLYLETNICLLKNRNSVVQLFLKTACQVE